MYSNAGGKIRTLAKARGIIGIVCAAICVLVELITMFAAYGIIAVSGLVLGLLCVISPWPLYAFGQLVDGVHASVAAARGKPPPAMSSPTCRGARP